MSAPADDVEQGASGVLSTDAAVLSLGVGTVATEDSESALGHHDDSSVVGLRFASVGVPTGATIERAWLQFTAAGVSSGVAALTVRGVSADAAPQWRDDGPGPANLPGTEAAVVWTPGAWEADARGREQRTPNLASIIQEIIDRPGWSPGSPVSFIVTGSGLRSALSFDGSRRLAPRLVVQVSTAQRSEAPVAHASLKSASRVLVTWDIGQARASRYRVRDLETGQVDLRARRWASVDGLAAGTHCYAVRCLWGGAWTEWSDPACVTVGAAPGDLLPDLRSDPPGPGRQHMTVGDAQFPELADRLLLKFDGYVTNVGTGPLHVTGNPQHQDPDDLNSHDVWQWVRGSNESLRPLRRVPIQFETDDDHNHFHLMEIMRYSLWSGTGAEAVQVTPATKVGFCLEDSEPVPGHADPGPRTYVFTLISFCERGHPESTTLIMGITNGWRDLYPWSNNLQWIDVSEVPPGEYRIASEADPLDLVTELDEINPIAFNPEATVIPGYEPLAADGVADGATVIALGARRWDSDVLGAPELGDAVFMITSGPAHGTLDVATGIEFGVPQVTYTPHPGYTGTDVFSFSVRDASSPFPMVAPTADVEVAVAIAS